MILNTDFTAENLAGHVGGEFRSLTVKLRDGSDLGGLDVRVRSLHSLGKLLLVLLTLVFFLPIVLTGPLGVFVVQALVNAVLLSLTSKIVSGIEFDRARTTLWAAFALTILQTVAKMLL